MTLRCSIHRALRVARASVTWSAGLAALSLLVACTAPAFAAPVLDGNISDVVTQANTYISNGTGCGIVINDPAKDVCLSDPLIVPCTNSITTCINTGQYYVNGFDQILAVAAVQGTDAWWGIRTSGGQIGDSDGDGTDGQGSNCPPPGLGQNPEDGPGIAEGERYIIRLDTNCDGVTDIRISVLGGAGTKLPAVLITDGSGLNPIPGATGQAQYGTTDLEIHTSGLNLPAVFSMNTFVGSDFDGMSEDAAGPAKCNTPLVSLTIQKTADKPTICPGDKDRFTVTVTNTSTVPVSVNVRDILPAGWTYSDNVSGDFAFNSQNGQVVSFGPLSVPAGAAKTVSFDATSPADCLGPYENKAVADGAFTTPCLTEPSTALTDTARATVTCNSKPCVSNVHCQAPESACNGDQITLKGFATNCGDRPADVVITLNGHDHIINNVGAGQEAEFDTTFQFSCTPGPATQWSVSAVAKNSCGTSAPGSSTCSTACNTPPCVNNVSCSVPASACSNSQITLKGFATNCADRTEEIVITLSGPGGAIGSHAFNVANGAQAEFDTTITLSCTPGAGTTFTASAVARNNCGVTQPVSSSGCTVQCLAGPCVDQVSCSTSASSLCDGSSLKLTGNAHNCSDRSEQIVITLLGPNDVVLAARAFNVAAGASVSYDTTFTFNCTGAETKNYKASAVATNDCGTSAPVASSGCPVSCKPQPCVDQVSCSTSASALCDGSSLKLTGNAHNCSSAAEQIVLTLLGPNNVVLASRAFNVAAGASVSYDTTFTFNCTGTETKTYSVSAVGTNDCGSTSPVASSGCPVSCVTPPCVNNVSCSVPASACSGDRVTIKGFATNCGDRTAEIVITLSGPGGVIGSHAFNTAAGAQAEFDTTITFNCSAGLASNFTASAIARNSCGQTQAVTSSGCSIQCKTPPCATVSCQAPASASNGNPIQVSAIGHNCGDRNEDLLVCVLRNGVQVGCHWLRNVPPGQDARFDTTVTFACTGTEVVTYSATVSAVNDCGQSNTVSSESTCPVQCIQIGGSCPRTVGYWGAQCAQKGNGSTKYNITQLTAIASCIDSRVDIFNWTDKLAGFCAIINPPRPMDCRKQALRQFAGLLANACVGQLGIKDATGDSVHLSLEDPNPCKSAFPNAKTLGDLIDAIDDLMVQLQNSNVSPQGSAWCTASECADGINNGRGIPLDPRCSESGTSTSAPSRAASGELGIDGSDLDVNGSSSTQVLELYRPTPNPFSNTTNFAFQVSGSASQRVQIGIYDVAGRLIRELVNETKAPGHYQTVWNGQDQGGSTVSRGVYFIRAYVGGTRVGDANRILYLR